MQLHRARDEFEAVGVRVAVIGMGTPANAEHFRESQGVDLELLVDHRREAYRAAGTKVGTANEVMGPRRIVDGLRRGLRARVRQGRTVGHPAQLGGVMIVLSDGSVPYTHLAEHSGDNASNEELLEAARKAAPGG
ncbi:MAG: peroxiredoxin-like family protein [Thermoleophilaceae bacterium]